MSSNKSKLSKTSKSKAKSQEKSKSQMEESLSSVYDSGNVDSGILSGNLDSSLSVDVSPPPERQEGSSRDGKLASFKRMDSGVDVATDQLSSLDIDEQLDDLTPSKSERNFPNQVQNVDCGSWKNYLMVDEEGDTSLHIAVISNQYKDLLTLVLMLPDPKYLNIRNGMRQTALHLAVLTSQEKMVKLLVAAGAATDCVDHHGNTPLHLATAAGDLELVKELTETPPEARVDSIGLRYKPPKPSHAVPSEINMYNYEGLACVHLALMGGHIAILKHLVCYGADINAGELKEGLTPLHMASTMDDTGLVSTLIRELEADPCPLTYGGQSPFSLARGSQVKSNMMSCLLNLGSTCLGDSEEEDEDHLAAHCYSDSDDDDEMVDRSSQSMSNIRDFHLGVVA